MMQPFTYKARDKKGKALSGKVQAASVGEAKQLLLGQGLFVLSVMPAGSDFFSREWERLRDRVFDSISPEEMLVFNRQLQTSYSVGLSLIQALTMISEQTQSVRFRRVISSIIDEVSQGRALHEAMARYPDVFDSVYINAIMAGESSGKLDDILNMLCYFSEQQMESRAKIKGATFYPKIIVVVIIFVFFAVVYFVIPKIRGFYSKLGGELPELTLFVLAISDFFTTYWYLVLGVLLGSYIGVRKILATTAGRMRWDTFKLKLPVLGQILLQYELLIFSTVLNLLLKSGIPILSSFRIVRDSLTNEALRSEIDVCCKAVEEGKDISHGFRESQVFPKLIGNLISVGEESGKVDVVLEKVASYYKVQLEYRLNNFAKAIEPVFLVIIFGIVLVLVLAVFLPIWKMSQLMRAR